MQDPGDIFQILVIKYSAAVWLVSTAGFVLEICYRAGKTKERLIKVVVR